MILPYQGNCRLHRGPRTGSERKDVIDRWSRQGVVVSTQVRVYEWRQILENP